MENIKHKILVMSGKGGVGKTTITVNLAYALSKNGFNVGLLDVDICGPNIPKMVGLEDKKLHTENGKIIPLKTIDGVKVISMAFLLNKADAVIWRGPMKHNMIKQFIEDVNWGNLDYLVVDFPPGTGDEHISTSQLLGDVTGAVIVSTPQKVAILDSVRTIDFCKKMNIPVLGVIENMSGSIFGKGTLEKIAEENDIPFLGCIQMERSIAESGDSGKPFVLYQDESSKEFVQIVDKILTRLKKDD